MGSGQEEVVKKHFEQQIVTYGKQVHVPRNRLENVVPFRRTRLMVNVAFSGYDQPD